MGKRPVGSANAVMCEKSGILIEKRCEPGECETCGWNPEVNKRRRSEINWYARNKILYLWGMEKDMEERGDIGRKAIKYIKLALVRIATEESR